MYENPKFDETRRIKLRMTASVAEYAMSLIEQRTPEGNRKACELIETRLVRLLLAQYPEQKVLFEEYNE